MQSKLQRDDAKKIHYLLYVEIKSIYEVAKRYGYSDTSAFGRGLKSIGYCIANAVRPITPEKEIKSKT